MKASLNWLKDHLDLSGITTEEMSDRLTFAGIEVEEIEERGGGLDNVVVGQILASEPHPDADKLSVCSVDTGDASPRQIVCGAKNYAVNDRVPVALPGAELPGGFKIKESKLRGVDSAGMMCGASEIGINSEVDGLHILEGEPATGTPMAELVSPDTIFTIEVTPNRPDLLSHLGIARELAALAKIELSGENHHGNSPTPTRPATGEEVSIDPDVACPLYTARRISGVKVAPSPEWLTTKLEAIGLRPINNIVDITNYVLMEMGHPLHAFDTAKLEGGIRVRNATAAENFVALDGETYTLKDSDLVIADQNKAVAIAGVMGGEESGVTDTTTEIILESAYFTPSHIRRTSRELNLSSDSSYRFERGADPAQVLGASDLATKLILEIAGGTADPEILVAGETPAPPSPVELDHARAAKLIGAEITADAQADILNRLGLKKSAGDTDTSTWEIPSYRADLIRHIDLVEEIARVYGIDDVPARTIGSFGDSSPADLDYDLALSLKHQLAALGFCEAQTLKLIAGSQLPDAILNSPRELEKPVAPRNPLSDDHTTLRPSLLPGLLAAAGHNARHGSARIALFEIGKVFLNFGKAPVERDNLAILICGDNDAPSWANESSPADLHDIAGIVAALAPNAEITTKAKDLPNAPLAAEIRTGKSSLGHIAAIPPARARDLDLPGACFVAEIPLPNLKKLLTAKVAHSELHRFPAMSRDIAMEVPADLPASEVASFFASLEEPLLENTALFDVFADPSGEKLAADKKSLAYSLTYRRPDRTLESVEVDTAHAAILERLCANLPATTR